MNLVGGVVGTEKDKERRASSSFLSREKGREGRERVKQHLSC